MSEDIREIYKALSWPDKVDVRGAYVAITERLGQSNSMNLAFRRTINDGHSERAVMLAVKCIEARFLPY